MLDQNTIIVIVLIAVVMYYLNDEPCKKKRTREGFMASGPAPIGLNTDNKLIDDAIKQVKDSKQQPPSKSVADKSGVEPAAADRAESTFGQNYSLGVNPNDPKYNPLPSDKKAVLKAADLLPKQSNPDWFENPNSDFNLAKAISMEMPEYKFGIDTIGQSKRNASYDLRSAPPNPKFVVSPWNNSTIEPDYNIKSLC